MQSRLGHMVRYSAIKPKATIHRSLYLGYLNVGEKLCHQFLTRPCSKNDSGYIGKLKISKIKKTFLLCQSNPGQGKKYLCFM